MVTAYPVPNKRKSFEICLAFARGCGGQIGTNLRAGSAFFYGVTEGNEAEWRGARDGRDWYYSDNSVFDAVRQQQFRVTKNRLQHSGIGSSDGRRFAAMGIPIKPWRESGIHIVVCPQSAHFMRMLAQHNGQWSRELPARLACVTDRPVRIRPWSPDKGVLSRTLEHDLIGAHCLITWSSAAAVTAVLAGVPVIVESPDCCALPMSGTLEELENLPMPDRDNWASVLADQEWSLDEFRNGTAWRALNE